MSAAAARRKKQLAARAAASSSSSDNEKDAVIEQLEKLLHPPNDGEQLLSEEVAYEALQLAQSSIRKRIQQLMYADACNLAYTTALQLLQQKRVSVASQLLQLLADILRETQTFETDEWVNNIITLHNTHQMAMDGLTGFEPNRLQRLQRTWLLLMLKWSSEFGTTKYGHVKIQELLGLQCWKVSNENHDETDLEDIMELKCDAIQHMALAERPDIIVGWLRTLPKPTSDEVASGHECSPAVRDMLLTRAVLLFCAVENIRDATILVRTYMNEIEERSIPELQASYTKKDDGFAPAHIIFCNMLIRICQKDSRTAPLYQWLLKSFKKELEKFYKPNAIQSYHTKIGKLYFQLEPPPSMLKMMENMMSGFGGGGMGGGLGGIDPAMMQAALAQFQQGM